MPRKYCTYNGSQSHRESNLPLLTGTINVKKYFPYVVIVLLLRWNTLSEPEEVRGFRETKVVLDDATSGRIFKMQKIKTVKDSTLKFQEEHHHTATTSKKYVLPEGDFWNRPFCRNWATATTIFEPSTAVERLIRDITDHPDWCLVVAGDRKGPKSYIEAPNVVFLSVERQTELEATIPFVAMTPWNHFARKNVAYLYAIANGAQHIWDFDDDNELTTKFLFNVSSTEKKKQGHAVLPSFNSTCHVFNPYPKYKPSSKLIWPRGYPLDMIMTENCSLHGDQKPVLVSKDAICVYQAVANHDPDVDAIYRLSRPLPVDFEVVGKDPPLLVPHDIMVPFNAQATLWTRQGLWGLFLPITVHGRVSDIWRSLFVETIFRFSGCYASFVGAHVIQDRNAHTYLGDFDAEKPLYDRSGALVDYLLTWSPNAAHCQSIQCQVERLYADLVEHDILQQADLTSIQEWLTVLESIGYDFVASSVVDSKLEQVSVAPKESTPANTETTTPKPSKQETEDLLAEQWRHPDEPHCYKHGNDWSECAGEHLLYKKESTPEGILNRDVLCLFEPLCWKQLDWRNTEPPTFTCSVEEDMRLYDWSLHDGTMAGLSSALEVTMATATQKKMEVFLCNTKKAARSKKNYQYNFKLCPASPDLRLISTWKTPASDEMTKNYYEFSKTSAHMQMVDAHIVGFLPNMFDYLMAMNRSVIVNSLHRPDMYRCSELESRQTFDNMIRLASSGPTGRFPDGPTHIIAPGYVHDVEYVRHYTGIRPIYLPFSLLAILPRDPYTGTKNEYIWNGKLAIPETLAKSNFTFTQPKKYAMTDLLEYRATIVLPYSITNTKSLEQYELSIPMFAPTPQFALQLSLFHDRTATHGPYCKHTNFTDAMHPKAHASSPYEYSPNARLSDGPERGKDEEFWISFSEIYLWPCIDLFSSWEELLTKLGDHEKLREMSKCMQQANKWRKYELDSNLCWVLQHISNHDRSVLPSYEETLNGLYGVSSLYSPT